MSTWGHRARLGDRRLTRAAMDATSRSSTVASAMFFGSAPGGGVTATLSAVLVAMTLSASAAPAVAATSARTLPGLTSTGSASAAVSGSLARTLPGFTLASSSTVAVAAGADRTLPGFGLTSSSTVDLLAQFSGLLSLSLTASASIDETEPLTASLAATFPTLTLYARAFAEAPLVHRQPRRVATHIRARSLRVRRVR